MKVIEPGHIYELEYLDPEQGLSSQHLMFVNREEGTEHPGTQSQEVLRACIEIMEVLIDRTNHCDSCLPWPDNERIIKAMSEAQRQMRLAIIFHEQRAIERKMEKDGLRPEQVKIEDDGHWPIGEES